MHRPHEDDFGWTIGRYTLHGEIAAGGMASVHIGRMVGDVGFAKLVAIKRLHGHLARDPDFLQMFLDEARLASRIRHPNVVQPLDVLTVDGEVLLVMEYVHGESLSRLQRVLRATGQRIPIRIASAIVSGMLHGLHAAHEAKSERGEPLGIVHRDVSPQNVLVGVDGVARVLDFGIAKAADQVQHTREGELKGKLAYMAPEQIHGKGADRRTDVFAAAVVLWECLTGQRLLDIDTQSPWVAVQLHKKIEPPSHVNPELSPEIDALVMKGLAMDPADRWPSARDMALRLEELIHPATQSQVGAWVETTAAAAIADRKARIDAIEEMGARELSRPDAAAVLSGAHRPVDDMSARDLISEPSHPSRRTSPSRRTGPGTGPRPPTPAPPVVAAPPPPPPRPQAPDSLAGTVSEGPAARRPLVVPSGRPEPSGPRLPPSGSPEPNLEDTPAKSLRAPRLPPPGIVVSEPVGRVDDAVLSSPDHRVSQMLAPPTVPMTHAAPAKTTVVAVRGRTRSFVPYLWLLVAIGLAAGFIAAPDLVRKRVVEKAAEAGLVLTVEDVDLSVSKGQIVLKKVVATSPDVPNCSLNAGYVTLGMYGADISSVTIDNARFTLDGSYASIAGGWAKHMEAHPHGSVVGGAGHVSVRGAEVLWTAPLGPGTQLEGSSLVAEIAKKGDGELGDDSSTLTLPAGKLTTPLGVFGPWRYDVARDTGLTRVRLTLDSNAGANAGPVITVNEESPRKVLVDSKLARVDVNKLGLPMGFLGVDTESDGKLDLSLHAEITPATVLVQLHGQVASLHVGGGAADGSIDGRVSGARGAMLPLEDGTLTLAGQAAKLSGSLSAGLGGELRVSASGRPRPCDADWKVFFDTQDPSKATAGMVSRAACRIPAAPKRAAPTP
jgi:serine/threonine-protein kinase